MEQMDAMGAGEVHIIRQVCEGLVMIMASCYSCRKKFRPSELRVSYSKNYCEECGLGLFGGDYFGFAEKPDPTVKRTIAVYLKVIFSWGTALWLLILLFWLVKGA
jgi:hypothetical protein